MEKYSGRRDFLWLSVEQKTQCQTVRKVLLLVGQHTEMTTWHTIFLIHFSMIKVEATIDYTEQFHDKRDMIAIGYLPHGKHLVCPQSIQQSRGNKLKYYNTRFQDGFGTFPPHLICPLFFIVCCFLWKKKQNKDNKKVNPTNRQFFSALLKLAKS